MEKGTISPTSAIRLSTVPEMGAMYVYLAAKAYDYETTLLDYNTMAGQRFLTNIVRQRTIGTIEGGQPLTGSGLADPMKNPLPSIKTSG